MHDELLEYYNRELTYLRKMGAQFARDYPKVAGRLLLEENKCEDPHVERLLEGFAFLAARTRLRIDDDLPEFTEGMLDLLAPQHVRPLPSFSLVRLALDPEQGSPTSGYRVARQTTLFSRAVREVRFRTCYDTVLWPLQVEGARWGSPLEMDPPLRVGEASAALSLHLACDPEVELAGLEVEKLRFYLDAEADLAATLYELLLGRCAGVVVRDPDDPEREAVTLPASAVQPVGFEQDEGLVPFENRALLAHRLLQEYFAFTEKYLFLDVTGLECLRSFGTRAELVFLIRPFERAERVTMLETGVTRRTFRMGCTPVVNLFERRAEPITFGHERPEYLVVPDSRRRDSIRVFSVDAVEGIDTETSRAVPFTPLYSIRHGNDEDHVYWYPRRRRLGWRKDQGTDVFLSFVDRKGKLTRATWNAVGVSVTCHNGDIPSRLPMGLKGGDFEAEGGGPFGDIVTLVKPTRVLEPPLGESVLWRLISQASLNYMSLVDGGGQALRELLHLHNRSELGPGQKQIDGIREVTSRTSYARVHSEHGLAFARGHQVELMLDEASYAGGGAYLFAAIIERFLALYVSINSFSALRVRTLQRQDPLAEWVPRSGRKVLL